VTPLPERWSVERARAWFAPLPWLVGANYAPACAINQLEMWQAETFAPEAMDRELAWASWLGMNTLRVFLHHLPWVEDAAGFAARIDRFLAICARHGIRPMLVLCDDCWHPDPRPGPQPEPRPHTHNSGWVQCPGRAILENPARHPEIEAYVGGVVARFADDPRVLAWDLYNEPGNIPGPYAEIEAPDKEALTLALLPKLLRAARAAAPSQPLTIGVWSGDHSVPDLLTPLQALMLSQSDILSFHQYSDLATTRAAAAPLLATGRPVFCTEYLARGHGSTFEAVLPFFKESGIAAYNWGLVAGRSQTQYPWKSWGGGFDAEPAVWHHDILRPDGSPFDPAEVHLLRKLTAEARA
jgi:hypothetical protein